jgi:hypothetical protein
MRVYGSTGGKKLEIMAKANVETYASRKQPSASSVVAKSIKPGRPSGVR